MNSSPSEGSIPRRSHFIVARFTLTSGSFAALVSHNSVQARCPSNRGLAGGAQAISAHSALPSP